jgi:hypothetical protein
MAAFIQWTTILMKVADGQIISKIMGKGNNELLKGNNKRVLSGVQRSAMKLNELINKLYYTFKMRATP